MVSATSSLSPPPPPRQLANNNPSTNVHISVGQDNCGLQSALTQLHGNANSRSDSHQLHLLRTRIIRTQPTSHLQPAPLHPAKVFRKLFAYFNYFVRVAAVCDCAGVAHLKHCGPRILFDVRAQSSPSIWLVKTGWLVAHNFEYKLPLAGHVGPWVKPRRPLHCLLQPISAVGPRAPARTMSARNYAPGFAPIFPTPTGDADDDAGDDGDS